MKIPNIERATISFGKIAYLMNPVHPDNRGKAGTFFDLGFRPANPWQLADVLRSHGRDHDYAERKVTPFGIRYDVVAPLTGPNGTTKTIRSGWVMKDGTDAPQFQTAFEPKPRTRQ